jgi:predicted amidohydrolase
MNLSVVQMNSSPDRDANVEKACALIDTAVTRDGVVDADRILNDWVA